MSSKSTKMALNSALVVIGFIFNKAISFLMIPIFTRILTTDEYGKVSTYVAWVAVLAYVIGLALEYSVRNAVIDYNEKVNSYMSAICGLSVVSLIVIGGLVFTANKFFVNQMSDILCVCCVLHAYVHALVNYFNMKFTMYQQYVKRVLILVMPNLLSSVLGVILILNMADEKHVGRVLGYIFILVPLGIFLLVQQFIKGRVFYKADYWKYALAISLPMIAHGLSGVIMTNFDRILVSFFRGDSESGVYSLVYNFSMIAIAFTTAIENIWIPWFTRRMEENRCARINQYVKVYIYVVVVVICGILLIAPEALMLMAAKEYWSGKRIIAPIVLSSFFVFLYSLHVAVEIYYKSSRYTAFNTFIAASFSIIADILFIPYFGMAAAAYTTLASYMLSFAMHYRYSRKLNRDLFPFKIYLWPIAIVIGTAIYSYVFMEVLVARWIVAVMLGCGALAAFVKKDELLGWMERS